EGPSIEGPSIEGPSIEGPSIEGPSIEGPSIEGPSIEGPSIERPSKGPALIPLPLQRSRSATTRRGHVEGSCRGAVQRSCPEKRASIGITQRDRPEGPFKWTGQRDLAEGPWTRETSKRARGPSPLDHQEGRFRPREPFWAVWNALAEGKVVVALLRALPGGFPRTGGLFKDRGKGGLASVSHPCAHAARCQESRLAHKECPKPGSKPRRISFRGLSEARAPPRAPRRATSGRLSEP
ncbi:hypothetical protein M885DRAFT_184498, partial [Pelagophyceae sp. CCMP2097]